jgi:hypothetical protein
VIFDEYEGGGDYASCEVELVKCDDVIKLINDTLHNLILQISECNSSTEHAEFKADAEEGGIIILLIIALILHLLQFKFYGNLKRKVNLI